MSKKKLLTIAEVGRETNWGFNGTYFNTQQPGFPTPVEVTEDGPLYDIEEILKWDRNRPGIGPITDVIIIRSIN